MGNKENDCVTSSRKRPFDCVGVTQNEVRHMRQVLGDDDPYIDSGDEDQFEDSGSEYLPSSESSNESADETISDEDQYEITVSKALCSCKGGMSGRCKHVAAVLILCTRDDMKNLPAISSTDMKCYWKKSTIVEKYKAIPIKEHGCFIRNSLSKVKDVRVDADVLLSKLILVCPNSALAKHRIGHRIVTMETVTGEGQASILFENALNSVPLNNMPQIIPVKDCCRNIYREICNIDILSVELETKSCKEKWFKERQFRITASRCYELYTYSLNEWDKKAAKYFWPKKFCNKYVDHGVQFESAARDCYIASSNCQVIQSGLIISSQQKWLACSPDGIVFEGNTPVKLLEIKCPFEGTTSI
ncbi:exonuclease phage-type/recb c-terminal domain-containing protein [Holotrichia oblita]|uniref:Exonuclease phage-type/recb c-terminal domain-containing protein n=1 Tax=Holotrichia oblita TaxID=644536 RepID=A0ACB9SLK0_HOLOL|nr:exonuclease phage-type/recb c-terminal domain-containing protein [Holotrichia oblita]